VLDTISICEEIVYELLKDGYRIQARKQDIEKAVMLTRGIDQRTSQRWINALVTFEFIKPVNRMVYEINALKVPHLFHILKNQPQTHLE